MKAPGREKGGGVSEELAKVLLIRAVVYYLVIDLGEYAVLVDFISNWVVADASEVCGGITEHLNTGDLSGLNYQSRRHTFVSICSVLAGNLLHSLTKTLS